MSDKVLRSTTSTLSLWLPSFTTVTKASVAGTSSLQLSFDALAISAIRMLRGPRQGTCVSRHCLAAAPGPRPPSRAPPDRPMWPASAASEYCLGWRAGACSLLQASCLRYAVVVFRDVWRLGLPSRWHLECSSLATSMC
jgi:hypothetical protein